MITACSIGGFLFWKSSSTPPEPEIRVPEEVCGGVVDGKTVSPLFPSTGSPYQESDHTFAKTGTRDNCMISAGGLKVDFNLYGYAPGSSMSDGWVDEEIRKKGEGHVAISLGDAAGYADNRGARLYVECLQPTGGSRLIGLWVNYYDVPDEEVPKNKRGAFARAAAEGIKYSTGPEGLNCEEHGDLVDASLTVGPEGGSSR
ncbi:hypothetical protein ACFW9F_02350 [Streptomyces sp. NPDC059506]|uniref:hypothetical protein n=1 Tax=Streptomyces sp. NPDC059506 TaxID=3347751 RepID=UPI0036D08EE2